MKTSMRIFGLLLSVGAVACADDSSEVERESTLRDYCQREIECGEVHDSLESCISDQNQELESEAAEFGDEASHDLLLWYACAVRHGECYDDGVEAGFRERDDPGQPCAWFWE